MLAKYEIMSATQKINFFSDDISPTLRNRTKLKDFIEDVFKKEKREIELISYIFCSDKALLLINKKFLKHDFFTDIITFDLSSGKKKISAEIYISVDRVKENAKILGVSSRSELHRVIFHGALHLCGFKDKSKKDAEKMRKTENKLLDKFLIR